MGIGYKAAYRAGVIPWEKAGRNGRPALDRLLEREERARSERGRALDLGCGRGAHTKLLIDRGWDAIGVDDVRQAVDVAVRRNGLEDARFVVGDVRHLVHSGVGREFDLFLDVGCFHGLDDVGRTLMAGSVTALARPGSTVLGHAAAPKRRALGPRGADQRDLERAFRDWTVEPVPAEPADAGSAGRPGAWYRLTRS